MPVELVTVPDVPLVTTGTYTLSTGPATFTEEDLRAAVAALADPAVKVPRIKLGHLDPRFAAASEGMLDGEPALGRVENLRVSEDGQTLLGDYLVPAWLAADLATFYPARSIEGMQGWESPTGKRHDLVLTAVSLLGTEWPGVTTLEDLQELMSENGPAPAEQPVLASLPARPGRVAAGLDQDLVRRRFYDACEAGDLDLPDGAIAWDLWVRSMRFDDGGTPYLKVDDEANGRLYRVDFTVSGSEVTFGEFVEVVEQDVPVAAGAAPARPAGARTLATWASREDSRLVLATHNPQEEAPSMTDEQRRALALRLGLAEDATEEAIFEAAAETPPPPDPAPDGEPAPEGEPEPERQPVAASRPPAGAVMIDAEELAALRAGAQTAVTLAERQATELRDRTIAAAMSEGRFPPSRREHYETAWAADPEGTRHLLTAPEADGGLAPNTIPVAARGAEPAGEAAAIEEEHEAYMARHFPQASQGRRHGGRIRHRVEV